MKYIGGYSILDLTDTTNVSKQANICYTQDKPVLVYGANGEKYFADSITKSGTNIIITKGGQTITIANDNTITIVGDIQEKKLYLYILDLAGVTLQTNVTLPNGPYLAIISNENFDETIPNGNYRAYNCLYGYNSDTYNIYTLHIADGEVEVYHDSGDVNVAICDDYDMSIYEKSEFII